MCSKLTINHMKQVYSWFGIKHLKFMEVARCLQDKKITKKVYLNIYQTTRDI